MYNSDSRAALNLFHRINESGSGSLSMQALSSSVQRVPEEAYLRWLLLHSAQHLGKLQ